MTNSMTGRRKSAPRGRRSDAQKHEAVLVFLKHPNLCQLSDREISRRTRVSQPFVSKLRKTVISAESTAPLGLITRTHGPTASGMEGILDPPALDPYAWVTANARHQRQFVDAVGLRALYNAAPPDHRDAFVAWLLTQLPENDRPDHLPSNVHMYLSLTEGRSSDEGLGIPDFLRRKHESEDVR
jgi:hypothetical protein